MENNKYIEVQTIKIKQLQNGFVFIGKINYSDLDKIHRLTERKESYYDPIEDKSVQYKSDVEFQRQLSKNKLSEIKNYLEEEFQYLKDGKSLGMFPSSLILSLNSFDVDDLNLEKKQKELFEKGELLINEEMIINSYTPELGACFYLPLNKEEDLFKLFIPRNNNICLIVDGQHRFAGTKLFIDSIKDEEQKSRVKEFEFIATFLIGFDLFEVGQVFATVNFNQKPVNRSLYYDIFGSAPQTDRSGSIQNDIKLAHDLALHLQNNEHSPIRGMIKLLGKGYGLFSQAFFVEKMILIFKSGIWDDLLVDYINGGKEYVKIASFMKIYLEALKESYAECWPKTVERDGKQVYSSFSYNFILCKTSGLGAFFRLVRDVYPLYKSLTDTELKNELLKLFKHINKKEALEYFHKDGNFGGSGSEGLQSKLYKELKNKFSL